MATTLSIKPKSFYDSINPGRANPKEVLDQLKIAYQKHGNEIPADLKLSNLIDNGHSPEFAKRWSSLIPWEGRAAAEKNYFIKLLNNLKISFPGTKVFDILDISAGTGISVDALSRAAQSLNLQINIKAADASENMLTQAKIKLKQYNNIEYVEAKWGSLSATPDIANIKYHLVYSKGNSFTYSHPEDRDRYINDFFQMLLGNGILSIDHRNYDAILKGSQINNGLTYAGDPQQQPQIVKASITNEDVRFLYIFPDGYIGGLHMHTIFTNQFKERLQNQGFTVLDGLTFYNNKSKENYESNLPAGFITQSFQKPA